jgi:hypothetical protein
MEYVIIQRAQKAFPRGGLRKPLSVLRHCWPEEERKRAEDITPRVLRGVTIGFFAVRRKNKMNCFY